MKQVSARAKAAIVEALYRWADPAEPLTENRLKDLCEIADIVIRKLDAAGYAIELKERLSGKIQAFDIGQQALRVRQAETLVKEWVAEQSRIGKVASAQEAPAWRDYQREHDRFNSVVTAADAHARLTDLPEQATLTEQAASSDQVVGAGADQTASSNQVVDPDQAASSGQAALSTQATLKGESALPDQVAALPEDAALPDQVADPDQAASCEKAA